MDDIHGQVYHKLEEVLINTIKTWGLSDRDSKAHAELILDFGHTGVHDLAMEVNEILENEYA
jgi:hypothetical protein